MSAIEQSIHATTSLMIGEPLPAAFQPTLENLSAPLPANTRAASSWSSARMFTQNDPASWILGQLDDDFPGQNPTSGGSRDTEKNEPTARPTGAWPSGWAAMTVTPVGKWPRVW